jgi:hypothetical protein
MLLFARARKETIKHITELLFRWTILLKGYKIESVQYFKSKFGWFLTFLECLERQILDFACFCDNITNFNDWLVWKPTHNFCTSFLLCHWSIFSSVLPSLEAGKIRVKLHVLCGFWYNFSGPQSGRVPVSFFMVNLPFRASEVKGRFFWIIKINS